MKSGSPTRRCLVCGADTFSPGWHSILEGERGICQGCHAMLAPCLRSFSLNGWKVLYLYDYGESFRNLLYLFKGCGDYVLAPLFLRPLAPFLTLRFLGRTMVPAPSSKEGDEKRGYNHVVEIFSQLSLRMEPLFEKTTSIKQSDLSESERKKVRDRLVFQQGKEKFPRGRRFLLVDDVSTTGSTLLAMREMLLEKGARSVDGLVLAHVEKKGGSAIGFAPLEGQ